MDRLLTPAYRQLTPLEDQLRELLEKLDLSTAMKHSPSRSKRLKLLKKTILEVRSEMSLKKSLPAPPPAPTEPTPTDPAPTEPAPAPAESEEKPLPSPPAEPCTRPEEELFPPPTLELLTSLSQLDVAPGDPEPPLLKPSTDHTPMELDGVTNTSTSVPSDPPDRHTPDPLLYNGDLHDEAPGACGRRTNAPFRKSKSASPQKPPKTQEASAAPAPPLGAKTFLSVVIPRLETLLLPKKRRRSADGEEEEESPIKRLGTGTERCSCLERWRCSCRNPLLSLCLPSGIANGFVVEEEEVSMSPRLLEPRRRCASESSISSGGGVLCGTRWVQHEASRPERCENQRDVGRLVLRSCTPRALISCSHNKLVCVCD